MWWSTSSGRIELQMTLSQARSASHPGPCDEDVKELLKEPKIRRQVAKIPDELLRKELKEYGAWDEEELQDRAANEERLVWCAACDISEEATSKGR